jgi:outer membrane receptor protein involved in Fe transport
VGPYFAVGVAGKHKFAIDGDGQGARDQEWDYKVFKKNDKATIENPYFQRWDAVLGFRIGAEYTLYDRNYAYYSLSGSNLSLGKEMNLLQPWKIPTGGCLDMRASYHFQIGKVNATLSGNINNVLNQLYIEKAWNPSTVSENITEVNANNVYFYFAKGTTYNVRLKISF